MVEVFILLWSALMGLDDYARKSFRPWHHLFELADIWKGLAERAERIVRRVELGRLS